MKKQRKPNGWQRVLIAIQNGDVYTKDDLSVLLANKKIHMYRMANYMLDIKLFANGIIKSHKDGRKVVGYQIMNPGTVQKYLTDNGFIKGKKAEKLSDMSTVAPVTETVQQETVTS
jgi:hypothetical protein